MTRKYLTLCVFSFLCAVSINQLQAQEEKSKTQVIVVEKSIDKDGNVEMKKIMKSGKEAASYLKEIELEEIGESDKATVKKKSHYRIVRQDEDGNEEIIEWSGSGEVPQEIRKWTDEDMDQFNISVQGKKHVELRIDENGVQKEIMIEISGDDFDLEIPEDGEIEIDVIKNTASRKAQLGVMIEETADAKGVRVIDIVKGSAAEKAGIREGDLITLVEGVEIDTPEALVGAIRDRQPGEEIKIGFLRNGEEYVMKVALQKFEMWKEVEHDDDVEERIIIKKKN